MEANSGKVFSVDLVKDIEEHLELHYSENGNAFLKEMNVRKIIFEVIDKIKTNPRYFNKNKNKDEWKRTIGNLIIKFISDSNRTLVEKNDDSKVYNNNLEKLIISREQDIDNKEQIVKERKNLILDSKYAIIKNQNEIEFKFDNALKVKNLRIKLVTIKTKTEIPNCTCLKLKVKQLQTSKFYNHKELIDCYDSLIIDNFIKLNDEYLYQFKSLKSDDSNGIDMYFSKLTFTMIFDKEQLKFTNKYEIGSIFKIDECLTNIQPTLEINEGFIGKNIILSSSDNSVIESNEMNHYDKDNNIIQFQNENSNIGDFKYIEMTLKQCNIYIEYF